VFIIIKPKADREARMGVTYSGNTARIRVYDPDAAAPPPAPTVPGMTGLDTDDETDDHAYYGFDFNNPPTANPTIRWTTPTKGVITLTGVTMSSGWVGVGADGIAVIGGMENDAGVMSGADRWRTVPTGNS